MTDHIGDANEKVVDLDKLEALAKAAPGRVWALEAGFLEINHAWPLFRLFGDCECGEGSNPICGNPGEAEAAAAFIIGAQPATILSLIASARRDAEEIERLRAKLDRYEGARISDVSDEEAGRMIKAFWATVEKWSGEEWNDQKAQRLGLMNMGLMQAMAMAAQSNAETFTYTANGVTHKGEPIGDWTVTIAPAAHTGEG